jgi:hypothetical protein
VDVIAPQLTGRVSGHVAVKRTKLRVGDGAQMATIGFVDNIKEVEKAEEPKAAKPAAKKAPAKKKAAAKEAK